MSRVDGDWSSKVGATERLLPSLRAPPSPRRDHGAGSYRATASSGQLDYELSSWDLVVSCVVWKADGKTRAVVSGNRTEVASETPPPYAMTLAYFLLLDLYMLLGED